MSKLKEHLTEGRGADDFAKEIDGKFEDLLWQLEEMAIIPELNFNLKKDLHKHISSLGKLGKTIVKDLKGK